MLNFLIMKKQLIAKKKSQGFDKDIYLLGIDYDKTAYWLEAPKWDCGWYWGFGYVETYVNKAGNQTNPKNAYDIGSHQHISGFLGEQEIYNLEKQCWTKGEYVTNLIDSKHFESTTFTEDESWQLTELFKQFYLLVEMSDFTHKELPGCHITTSPVNHGDLKDWYKKINEVMIPAITTKILEILSPKE